jgi:hypothetical protein
MLGVGSNFGVTTRGELYCFSGQIGGWNITNDSLYAGTIGSENGIKLTTGVFEKDI